MAILCSHLNWSCSGNSNSHCMIYKSRVILIRTTIAFKKSVFLTNHTDQPMGNIFIICVFSSDLDDTWIITITITTIATTIITTFVGFKPLLANGAALFFWSARAVFCGRSVVCTVQCCIILYRIQHWSYDRRIYMRPYFSCGKFILMREKCRGRAFCTWMKTITGQYKGSVGEE